MPISSTKIANFFKKTGTAIFQKIKSNIVENETLKDFLFILLHILGGIVAFIVGGAVIVLLLALAHTYDIVAIILGIIMMITMPIVAFFESYKWNTRHWWYFPLCVIVEIAGICVFANMWWG